MNIVYPNDATHEISLIPRYYTSSNNIDLYLYNESTQEETTITISKTEIAFQNTYYISNGYFYLSFDFTFNNNDRYQYKIVDTSEEIIYRGLIFATREETQTFLNDNNEYYYE